MQTLSLQNGLNNVGTTAQDCSETRRNLRLKRRFICVSRGRFFGECNRLQSGDGAPNSLADLGG
jgi:hypothetical protein